MADTSKLKDIHANNASLALADTRHKELLAYNARTADTVLVSTEALIKYLEGHTTKTEVVNQLESIHTPDIEHVVKALKLLDDTLKTHENTDLTEVTNLMRGILDQAEKIPKELPTIPEQQVIDHTKHFQDLTKAIQAVEKVVKAQRLVVEAPVVNVPETNVHVDAPDLKPLQDGFRDVVKAVTDIVIPEYKTDNAAVEKLLQTANKTLQKILEKPISSGGGGGGSSWPAIGTNNLPAPLNLDASGNLKVTSTGGGGGGDASAANQVIGNASLASIDGKTPALGQVTMANSSPVVIASNQSAVPVSGAFFQATQPVSGPLTDTQLRATPVPVSGTVSTGGLTDTQLRATPVPVSLSSVPTHAVTNAGTFAVQNTAATPAGTNLIGYVGKKLGTTTTSINVPTSTTVATLYALNTSRVKAVVWNNSTTGILYVNEGAGATATNHTYQLAPATATSPGGSAIIDDYSGIITGILSTGTGTATGGETA